MSKSHKPSSDEAVKKQADQGSTPVSKRPDPFALLSNEQVQETQQRAAEGASGNEVAFPHLEELQAAFGDSFDMSQAQAHVDAGATADTSSEAYTQGSHAVFSEAPSLDLAAEEAVHIVQQAAGKGPSSGVGTAQDSQEHEARAIADKVAQGQDVSKDINQITGGRRMTGPVHSWAVQRREDPLPQKEVQENTMKRLEAARAAIEHTKSILEYGAGNQVEAIEETDSNSYYRMQAGRSNWNFDIPPEVQELRRKDPMAFMAAKAQLTQGGNCGEHAALAYDYLRQALPGEHIQYSQTKDLDHAYVIIGDPSKESDSELVVADPWPTAPTACLWEDHFAYNPERENLLSHASAQGDDTDYRQQMLDAGLQLNDRGQAAIQQTDAPEQVREKMEADWAWDHQDAAGEKFEYVLPEGQAAETDKQEDPWWKFW